MKNIYRLTIRDDATFQSDGEQIYKSKTVEDTLANLNLYQKRIWLTVKKYDMENDQMIRFHKSFLIIFV